MKIDWKEWPNGHYKHFDVPEAFGFKVGEYAHECVIRKKELVTDKLYTNKITYIESIDETVRLYNIEFTTSKGCWTSWYIWSKKGKNGEILLDDSKIANKKGRVILPRPQILDAINILEKQQFEMRLEEQKRLDERDELILKIQKIKERIVKGELN